MEEDYKALKYSYLRLEAQYKELRGLLEHKKKQWSEQFADYELTNDKMRRFCEEILSMRRLHAEKSRHWSDMDLDELLAEARKAYFEFIENDTKLIKQILATAEERRQIIEGLEDQIAAMKMNPGNINLAADETKALDDKEKQKPAEDKNYSPSMKEALLKGNVVITEDETDSPVLHETEKDLIETATQISEQAKVTRRSMAKTETRKKAEERAKVKNKKQISIYTEDLNKAKEIMKDIDWLMLDIIAETGYSTYSDIEDAMLRRNAELTKYAIYNAEKTLESAQLVDVVKASVPLSGAFRAIKLSDKGVMMYKREYDKTPVQSEMSRILAEHGSVEHGYGIKSIADTLIANKTFKSVEYMTRRTPIKFNDGSSCMPDIICTDKNDYKIYIEYELGNTTQTEFNGKMSKCAKISRYINIIGPNDKALDNLKTQVQRWMETKGRSIDKKVIRLTTASKVKDVNIIKDSNWKMVFRPERGIEPEVNA